jgi:hypothetical protein
MNAAAGAMNAVAVPKYFVTFHAVIELSAVGCVQLLSSRRRWSDDRASS